MNAERNRKLKSAIEKAFGRGKVRVYGHRGTASSWATVKIAYAPRNWAEAKELETKVWQIIRAAQIAVPTYGYDDPGSDYGFGNCLHINFEECQDHQAAREAGTLNAFYDEMRR